jgi:hypothetical protein
VPIHSTALFKWPVHLLELPAARRAEQQPAAERQTTRGYGPLQLAHRDEHRTDPRRQSRAGYAPLGARDRLAQLSARERGGELVVLGQLRDDDNEQVFRKIEQTYRPRARGDLNLPLRIASGRSCGRARARSPGASHAAHARVDALHVRFVELEPSVHVEHLLGHLLAHLQQQAEQLGRLLGADAAVRARPLVLHF